VARTSSSTTFTKDGRPSLALGCYGRRPCAKQFGGAVTRAVRSPSRLDEDLEQTQLLAATPIPLYLRIAGNPKFRSETSLGYEVGYRTLLTKRCFVDIAAFHNHCNNLTSLGTPVFSFESSPPPLREVATVQWANGIRGSTAGGEIAPDWKVAPWLEVKASHSYLNLDLENKPGSTDTGTVQKDQGSSPRHEFVLWPQFNLPKGLEFDPTYRYVSALPALLVRGYSTMDVDFGCRFAGQVELSVVGENLFQPKHAEFGGDPGGSIGIRRSVYAKIIWTSDGK
jgi:iron complex outermembrane recepter protein